MTERAPEPTGDTMPCPSCGEPDLPIWRYGPYPSGTYLRLPLHVRRHSGSATVCAGWQKRERQE